MRGAGHPAPGPGARVQSGQRRIQAIADDEVRDVVSALKRRRGGGEELLAYRAGGRRWVDVRSDDINAYVKDVTAHLLEGE